MADTTAPTLFESVGGGEEHSTRRPVVEAESDRDVRDGEWIVSESAPGHTEEYGVVLPTAWESWWAVVALESVRPALGRPSGFY